jgi:hypothetical protein
MIDSKMITDRMCLENGSAVNDSVDFRGQHEKLPQGTLV